MERPTSQNLLSACWGEQRVTIGVETPETLRRLSDTRALTCPGCGAQVVLHAGTVRAHHFAHLPGAVCSQPQTEPETEEHRAGKLLLAQWLRERLPDADVTIEAPIAETGQRADVLLSLPNPAGGVRRVALEFQCANLTAREWRRRHRLYREAGIADLWLLGGSRLNQEQGVGCRVWGVGEKPIEGTGNREQGTQPTPNTLHPTPDTRHPTPNAVTLRTGELERALLWEGAPLLFLDAVGERLSAGALARFRPAEDAQALRPVGRLSVKPLLSLDFPFALLDWPATTHPNHPTTQLPNYPIPQRPTPNAQRLSSDWWLWEWLAQRFRVTPENLAPFFGLPIGGQAAFACAARVWQAAIYYRFVHRRVGDGWWLAEVETWARAYLPLNRPVNPRRLHSALAEFQEMLAAAGFLSLPMGYGRTNARILADLTMLTAPPDVEEVTKLARYRRTLAREKSAGYSVAK